MTTKHQSNTSLTYHFMENNLIQLRGELVLAFYGSFQYGIIHPKITLVQVSHTTHGSIQTPTWLKCAPISSTCIHGRLCYPPPLPLECCSLPIPLHDFIPHLARRPITTIMHVNSSLHGKHVIETTNPRLTNIRNPPRT